MCDAEEALGRLEPDLYDMEEALCSTVLPLPPLDGAPWRAEEALF
jgi:hypothetical protein